MSEVSQVIYNDPLCLLMDVYDKMDENQMVGKPVNHGSETYPRFVIVPKKYCNVCSEKKTYIVLDLCYGEGEQVECRNLKVQNLMLPGEMPVLREQVTRTSNMTNMPFYFSLTQGDDSFYDRLAGTHESVEKQAKELDEELVSMLDDFMGKPYCTESAKMLGRFRKQTMGKLRDLILPMLEEAQPFKMEYAHDLTEEGIQKILADPDQKIKRFSPAFSFGTTNEKGEVTYGKKMKGKDIYLLFRCIFPDGSAVNTWEDLEFHDAWGKWIEEREEQKNGLIRSTLTGEMGVKDTAGWPHIYSLQAKLCSIPGKNNNLMSFNSFGYQTGKNLKEKREIADHFFSIPVGEIERCSRGLDYLVQIAQVKCKNSQDGNKAMAIFGMDDYGVTEVDVLTPNGLNDIVNKLDDWGSFDAPEEMDIEDSPEQKAMALMEYHNSVKKAVLLYNQKHKPVATAYYITLSFFNSKIASITGYGRWDNSVYQKNLEEFNSVGIVPVKKEDDPSFLFDQDMKSNYWFNVPNPFSFIKTELGDKKYQYEYNRMMGYFYHFTMGKKLEVSSLHNILYILNRLIQKLEDDKSGSYSVELKKWKLKGLYYSFMAKIEKEKGRTSFMDENMMHLRTLVDKANTEDEINAALKFIDEAQQTFTKNFVQNARAREVSGYLLGRIYGVMSSLQAYYLHKYPTRTANITSCRSNMMKKYPLKSIESMMSNAQFIFKDLGSSANIYRDRVNELEVLGRDLFMRDNLVPAREYFGMGEAEQMFCDMFRKQLLVKKSELKNKKEG